MEGLQERGRDRLRSVRKKVGRGGDRRRGARAAGEFGKMVKVQEAENQIVTHVEVFDERPRIRICCWRR